MKTKKLSLTEPGHFVVGCNYWASHAGTAMWADWQPVAVERDFKILSSSGLQVLRVFPLWPDFQPIRFMRGFGGSPVEVRLGEELPGDDEAGRAGVSADAISHFADFCRLADKYGLRLIVGLITGWMSGRYFVPPALEGRNVLTDPVAILWQTRFVKYFVGRFLGNKSIVAWDLGNECNCLANVTREEAWVWTSAIVNTVRSVDPSRPIVSGMHGLSAGPGGPWTCEDQGELTDLLTTHPYPIFTPYCDYDPVNTMRATLHADAQTRLTADIGGKPCLVEEIGTLGQMIASEQVVAESIRVRLFSLWAHDCHGLLWWCSSDQDHLEHAPYDWYAVERELGLVRKDGSAKPVLGEFGLFRAFLDTFPFTPLPKRIIDAVCILSDSQDAWPVAYSSFVLAKQAGMDVEFQYETQPIREAPVYLLPCVTGTRVINRHRWVELLERVRRGATLYISYQNGFISGFEEVAGLEVQTRSRRSSAAEVTMINLEGTPVLRFNEGLKLAVKPTRAQVLGVQEDGNPAFTVSKYGKGKVFFLSLPLEMEVAMRPGVIQDADAQPYWRVYREIVRSIRSGRVLSKNTPYVGLTEHPVDAKNRIAIAVNYAPEAKETQLKVHPGWRLKRSYRGRVNPDDIGIYCAIGANDAAVFLLQRK